MSANNLAINDGFDSIAGELVLQSPQTVIMEVDKEEQAAERRWAWSEERQKRSYADADADKVNQDIRRHMELLNGKEWPYAELGKEFYWFYDVCNREFFHGQLSTPIISIEPWRVSAVTTFQPGRDGIGALHHIIINDKYLHLPKYQLYAGLVHEMIHQEQQELRQEQTAPHYHNKWFQERADSIGICCCSKNGRCVEPKLSFLRFCFDCGIDVSAAAQAGSDALHEERLKGHSKLSKWACNCTNIWAANGSEPDYLCRKCNALLARK